MKQSFLAINLLLLSVFTPIIIGQTSKSLNRISEYCAVFREASEKPHTIKVSALMSYSTIPRVDGGDTFLYSIKCNNGDYFATTDFSNLKDLERWQEFFEKLPAGKNFIFEINLEGNLTVLISPLFGHLGWSRAEVEIIKINSIKDVSKKTQKPNHNARRPLIENGNSLQIYNTEVIFYLLKRKTELNIDMDELISSKYLLTDSKGNIFNKLNYQQNSERVLYSTFESISIANGILKKIGSQYKISGTVTFSQKDKIHKLNYENVFEFINNRLILTETKFSNL